MSPLVLRNAFNAFDPEKNGYINTAMVGTILSMLGHQLDDATLAEIIAEVDEDGSGQIEFEEFTTLAARFLVEEDAEAMMAELKEAFRLYDKEGNGYITTGVLREILRELDDKLTNDDLDMMIEEIDSDGSGTVDFDGKTVQFFIDQTKYLFVIFFLQNLWKLWLVATIKQLLLSYIPWRQLLYFIYNGILATFFDLVLKISIDPLYVLRITYILTINVID